MDHHSGRADHKQVESLQSSVDNNEGVRCLLKVDLDIACHKDSTVRAGFRVLRICVLCVS